MIGIGVVGCGFWGSNLIRNFTALENARVVGVCDLSRDRLNDTCEQHPEIRTHIRYHDLIADPKVDALVVATPAATHFPVALETLHAGKHVLVAKPLATSSAQARELNQQAEKRGLTLMVGHTFVYSGAVRRMRQIIAAGELGDLLYYDSVRVNLGVFQPDVNVLWDLAVHDLSILDYLLDVQPEAVSATGTQHLPGQQPNLAFLTLFYPGSLIAHMHVSWVAPTKQRRIHIGGTQQMLAYDDTEAEHKVRVHNKRVYNKNVTGDRTLGNGHPQVRYQNGDITTPALDLTEPLSTETAHFVDCLVHGQEPQTGARSGLRIISILEAATRSLEQRGRLIDLPQVDEWPDSPQLATALGQGG